MNTFSFVIFATLPFWPVAAAAQLNVLISGRVRRREQGRKRLPRSSPAACLPTW